MDKASKILFICFFLLISITISALYYKSFVTEDYEKTFSEETTVEQDDSAEVQ